VQILEQHKRDSVAPPANAVQRASAGGVYLFKRREREITVTELMAIASPANSGFSTVP
jgi:calcineurin-like phosphoesterase